MITLEVYKCIKREITKFTQLMRNRNKLKPKLLVLSSFFLFLTRCLVPILESDYICIQAAGGTFSSTA